MMESKAMVRTMVKAALLGATMLVAGAAAGTAMADTLADVKKAGVLTVATEMQFPPFDFLENNEYKGVDRDLIDEVAKELGVKAKYMDLPWTSVLPGLEAKKFDLVIAPVTITKERVKRYAFTVPISEATAALMKRADDKTINKPEDIAGKKVGGGKGTSQLAQVKEFGQTLPTPPDVREYVDSNQSYADLAAGRVDASVNSLPNLNFAASKRKDTFAVVLPPFGKPSYFSWVGRLDENDKSLIEAVNAALVKIQKDGRMATIQKKWFGVSQDLPTTVPEPQL
ncbi:transporter substrate-binding domain-containing protein [Azospirillum sp. A1-3]|uniref:transporter substrate-binding domain-containing protein n=1 Tax=Azospirillum sp. A1-3 TaxID=185874 RepID=UPI0020779869|nr:transporter substrate-binding domain-containing protein [Azospirillum sp. A1-3]MCM8737023.1 transporter substrate-binding domain-containing protein [Azospirillum sp. A1-3]